MAQYAVPRHESHSRTETSVANIASPAPLGLGLAALLTAFIGCFYTGFIIPFSSPGMRAGLGPVLLIGGAVLALAGMWEFRKGYLLTATTFTAYGGFLSFLGLLFFPGNGAIPALGGDVHLFLGMIYLAWTIFLGILCLGSLRTNVSLAVTLLFLFLAYFFLMLGSLASDNGVLLRVGGWLAIVAALIAWVASLASILSTDTRNDSFRLPMKDRLAVIEE
jgi:succinate-acetate transporter protein